MKLRILSLMTIMGMMLAFPAFALDLHEARSAGLVGEAPTGYVEPILSRADVLALVAEINSKRKQEYIRISQENGQSVDIVAKLAAEQIINRLNAGEYYKDANGNWKKR
jgi:hypothetical protein